jgi:serine/threonine protein kinase
MHVVLLTQTSSRWFICKTVEEAERWVHVIEKALLVLESRAKERRWLQVTQADEKMFDHKSRLGGSPDAPVYLASSRLRVEERCLLTWQPLAVLCLLAHRYDAHCLLSTLPRDVLVHLFQHYVRPTQDDLTVWGHACPSQPPARANRKTRWSVAVKRMSNVTEALARVNYLMQIEHEGIVRVLGCFLHLKPQEHPVSVVTEYLEGGTLDQLLRSMHFDKEAPWLAHQLVLVLSFLERRGLVHGRLNAHRVMLTLQGQMKLVGWNPLAFDEPPKCDVYHMGLLLWQTLDGKAFLERRELSARAGDGFDFVEQCLSQTHQATALLMHPFVHHEVALLKVVRRKLVETFTSPLIAF